VPIFRVTMNDRNSKVIALHYTLCMTQSIESSSHFKLFKLRKIFLIFILHQSKIILISLHKNKLELTKYRYPNIKQHRLVKGV